MVIDYSRTVNKYTLLDAYPLPRMQDAVQKVAAYKIYSTLDLISAYYQVKLPPSDRVYTAFEADGALWQWKRIYRFDLQTLRLVFSGLLTTSSNQKTVKVYSHIWTI